MTSSVAQPVTPPLKQPTPEAFTVDVAAAATPAQAYEPEKIMAHYSQRPWQVLGRFLTIAWAFLGFALALWRDRIFGAVQKNQRQRAIQLRDLVTKLGPTYIKVGQALSTRPDLLPAVYMEVLAGLQDQIPAFDNQIAYDLITEELGRSPQEIYAELSPKPVAAASLGQVYKGKLKTGETVAVKVQRPDLLERITLDIYLARTIGIFAQKNVKRLQSDLVAIIDEFAGRIFEELDYGQEGRNAELFAQLYGYIPEIYVPSIYWDYSGQRVLTMEWIEGTKLTQIEAVQAQGIDATYLVEVGVACSLRQLLEHGFFHADPHPGNLLATPDGKLAYLDFGMMSRIKPYQRYGLIEAVVHLVNRDFDALAHDYVNLEFLTPETDLQPIIPALTKVFGNALGASVAELNFKSITDQMSEMMYEFPFRVPAYYALIIRSLVTLEGIAIGVDPQFKVLSKAYPYIAKRLLTDQSPQLRASLRDLLFKEGSFRWNRLENLLRNAKNSQDYDFERVLTQTLDFLLSERGVFIRDRLVQEIVQAVDLFGQRSLFNASAMFRQQFGLAAVEMPGELQGTTVNTDNLEHIKNIWEILQQTQGFDPMLLASTLAKLPLKPEVQSMGEGIMNGLAERVMARLIRQWLTVTDESTDLSQPVLPSA